jgi:hypothetical protein
MSGSGVTAIDNSSAELGVDRDIFLGLRVFVRKGFVGLLAGDEAEGVILIQGATGHEGNKSP